MTQTLIESISQRFASHISGKAMTETVPISVYEWKQILSIINQEKAEMPEPVAIVSNAISLHTLTGKYNTIDTCLPAGTKLYTSHQPSHTKLIGELVEALNLISPGLDFTGWEGCDGSDIGTYINKTIAKAREAVKHE